jgi:ribosomal protein S18 acetylase RimI-like enzyme
MTDLTIRPATRDDDDAIWAIIGPAFAAGETYVVPRDIGRTDALAYWHSPGHYAFVAQTADGAVLGTYYLRANQKGGGAHVANCGYIVRPDTAGRGVARAMAAHSFEEARRRGFRAMQFNFVVSSNERAVRLWQSLGFDIVGRLPAAFEHPAKGFVDAFVMFRAL